MKKLMIASLFAMTLATIPALAQNNTYNMVIEMANGTKINIGPNEVKNINFVNGELTLSGSSIEDIIKSASNLQGYASIDKLNAAITTLKVELSDAIASGDAASLENLRKAIADVNNNLTALDGDLNTLVSSHNRTKEMLVNSISTVEKKVDGKADQTALDALQITVGGLQGSLLTTESVKTTVQNAIDLTKVEISKNVQAVETAVTKAQYDATNAKQDLASLAEKVNAYGSGIARDQAQIEAIQKSLSTIQSTIEKLQTALSNNPSDIKAINNELASLNVKISTVDSNLQTLINKNTNSIESLAGTIGNNNLQIAALIKFCGNLEGLNVPGIRDSLRIAFSQMRNTSKITSEDLAAAENRINAAVQTYVAALNRSITIRIDSIRDYYATHSELEALAQVTDVQSIKAELAALKQEIQLLKNGQQVVPENPTPDDPTPDDPGTDGVSAYYAGGAITQMNETIQSGSKLNWTFSNSGKRSVTLTGMQLINGSTGRVGNNMLTENVEVAAGKSVSYTVTVGILGIENPIMRFTYLFNGEEKNIEANYKSISF